MTVFISEAELEYSSEQELRSKLTAIFNALSHKQDAPEKTAQLRITAEKIQAAISRRILQPPRL